MILDKYEITINIDPIIKLNEFGHIYIFKNKINNKIYIGQSINVIRRINEHLKCKERDRNKPLTKSLLKEGISNFNIEIIDTATSIEELNEKEIFYIQKYKSNQKEFGYNIEAGGRNAIPTSETLEKMSKSHIGIKQTEEWINKRILSAGSEEAKKYGKPKTEEEKRYLSENSPKFWLNKTRDEETKKKISETKKKNGLSDKQKENSCKTVYKINISTGEIKQFESTAEASKIEEVDQSTISRWCGNNKLKGNFLWSYSLIEESIIKQ